MSLAREEKKIYTVSKITHYIQSLFTSDSNLRQVSVIGEISNFKCHSSGHMYFVLKDDRTQIKCVMFRGSNINLSFNPSEGLEVIAQGAVQVYENRGEYQLYVTQMKSAGKGNLFAAFEALKEKLKKEGLFDPAFKKSLPVLPKKVAIITSPTGAAVRDIISVSIRRFPNIHLMVVAAQVQGKDAAREIAEHIDFLNHSFPDLDFIIIGRGGGSIEELWAFNEEVLARAIFASRIPIVSAVGHETDFTISDFVADLRVPTPTGAAEMTIPDKKVLSQHLLLMHEKLNRAMIHLITIREQKMINLIQNLKYQSPENKLLQYFQTIDESKNHLLLAINHILKMNEKTFIKYKEKLETLNPKAVLNRGYSICFSFTEKKVIKKIQQVKKEDFLSILVSNGSISAKVTGKEKNI